MTVPAFSTCCRVRLALTVVSSPLSAARYTYSQRINVVGVVGLAASFSRYCPLVSMVKPFCPDVIFAPLTYQVHVPFTWLAPPPPLTVSTGVIYKGVAACAKSGLNAFGSLLTTCVVERSGLSTKFRVRPSTIRLNTTLFFALASAMICF